MKKVFLPTLFFCCAALALCAEAHGNTPTSPRGNAPAKFTGAVKTLGGSVADWNNATQLEKSVRGKISRAFKHWTPEEAEEFLSHEENQILLMRSDFLRTVPAKTITLLLKKSAARKTLQVFLTEPAWMESYLYTGTPKNPERFLELLCAITQSDAHALEPGILRNLATAVAAEFARNNWTKGGDERVLKRYKFYADSWRAGTLNVLFDDYGVWDLRIVAGCKGENNWGEEATLQWLQNNASFPESNYRSHVYQVPYRLHNKVGDLIHSNDYFTPFSGYFDDNPAPFAVEIGGVCGAVSHFAAFAACANGIAALTMGEPGHCAFSVRVKGKWFDGNSVSWERGCHWAIWENHREWVYLHLSEKLFTDGKKTPRSFQ